MAPAGYTLQFVAQVKDGFLRGDQGTEGAAGWFRLKGDIQPDGTARLDAKGVTGDPKFNPKGVQKGAPYAYQVAAVSRARVGPVAACRLRLGLGLAI